MKEYQPTQPARDIEDASTEGVDAILAHTHSGQHIPNPYNLRTPLWHAWQEGYDS